MYILANKIRKVNEVNAEWHAKNSTLYTILNESGIRFLTKFKQSLSHLQKLDYTGYL